MITKQQCNTFGVVLLCSLLFVGCGKRSPRSQQTGGFAGNLTGSNQQQPTNSGAITISLVPEGKVTLIQGATLNIDAVVRVGGVEVENPEGQGLLTYELLNTSVGSINAQTGMFTASSTATGASALRATFTQNGVVTSVDFLDHLTVVNSSTNGSPPRTIRLEPVPRQVVQGESFVFRLFVELENGTTIEPMPSEYSAVLSNVGIGSLNLLTFTAFNTLTGASDINVDVTLAGVTISQTFAGAVEVISANGGGGGGTTPPVGNFHGNTLADIAIVTSQVGTLTHGLVAYGPITATSGNDATTKIRLFLGVFGSDDNTPVAGDIVYFHPNYQDGAEANRPAADYVPLAMTPVAGTNNLVWELEFTKFPTTGTLSFTATTNGTASAPGTTFMRGFPNDTSFNPARNNLEATLNNGNIEPRVNP